MVASPSRIVEPTGWMTTCDGASIPYRIQGSGPAVVLLHGWSQSGAMFHHQLEAMSGLFKVIVPDLRGHGEAPDPGHGFRMARLAADLAELLDHLGLQSCHLLGWSMGVSIIWAYIDLFGTARIDKLIFVDQPAMLTSLPDMSPEETTECGALFTLLQLGELYCRLKSASARATRAEFVRSMVTDKISDELFDWIVAENDKTPTRVAAALLLSHCTHDWRDVLPGIDRPTLVIAGSVSHVKPASQRYIQKQISGASYHEFPHAHGGAHFPFLEAPDAFNRVVIDFLSSR